MLAETMQTTTETDLKMTQEADEKYCENEKYKFLFWKFETPIKWFNVLTYTLLHVFGVYFLLTHDFRYYGILIYGIIMANLAAFGVTGGVHRYFTHRSYQAKLPLKIILIICYLSAGQYSIVSWVRDHRIHHKFSETAADPHDSRRGFFFSHVGWLMMKKRPEVIKKGKQIDLSDLYNDPVVMFCEKYFIWLKILVTFVIPSVIPPLLYGESWMRSIKCAVFVKYIYSLNCTWAVNSAAHFWGTKPYDKNINPSENMVVSFLSVGEGYHNYHHTFPWDYRAAELGSKINLTTLLINFFHSIGWAYDLKSPSSNLVKRVIEKGGDGSHYRWGKEVSIEQE